MSRHDLQAKPDSPDVVRATVGWDRPLQTFFAQVFFRTEDEPAEGEPSSGSARSRANSSPPRPRSPLSRLMPSFLPTSTGSSLPTCSRPSASRMAASKSPPSATCSALPTEAAIRQVPAQPSRCRHEPFQGPIINGPRDHGAVAERARCAGPTRGDYHGRPGIRLHRHRRRA